MFIRNVWFWSYGCTDVYRESILELARKKTLVSSHIALVQLTFVSTWFSVLPGFGPAAEVPSMGLRTGLLFWQKDPKPVTPRPVSLRWDGRKH